MSSSLASASVYWRVYMPFVRYSVFPLWQLCIVWHRCRWFALLLIPRVYAHTENLLYPIHSCMQWMCCAVRACMRTDKWCYDKHIHREKERRRERERTMNTRATDTKCKEYTHRWMRVLVLLALHFGWIFVKFSARHLFFYITSYLLEKSWCCNDSVGFDMDLHEQMWAKSTFG